MIKKAKKSKEIEKSSKKNIILKRLTIILISLLVSIYLLGVAVFSFIALPNTKLNGHDISYLMIDDVFNKDWTDYSIKINRSDGKNDFFKPEKINYKENYLTSKKLLQNQFLWPLAFFTSKNIKLDVEVSYDDKKFEEFLKNTLVLKGLKRPEDAKIIFKDGQYIIKEEVLGTFTTKEKLKEGLLATISERKDSFDMNTISEQPKVKKDDKNLKEAVKKYEKISKLKYNILIDEIKEVLDGESLSNVFTFSDGDLKPDEQKVKEYVRRLAIKYNTFKIDRKFKTTGKGEITIPGKDGIYGWQIDIEKTKDLLIEKLLNFKSEDITPVFINEGLLYNKNGDFGNTYIEIDLTRQHMWFYKNGNLLLDTDVVTGDVSKNVETPIGFMKVWSRENGKNLKGLTPEGYDYVTPVKYWMPINWTGVGIHDANWRNGNFGGNIYRTQGSYGCINTPFDKVKSIYENVEINTPVVIYKS